MHGLRYIEQVKNIVIFAESFDFKAKWSVFFRRTDSTGWIFEVMIEHVNLEEDRKSGGVGESKMQY